MCLMLVCAFPPLDELIGAPGASARDEEGGGSDDLVQ